MVTTPSQIRSAEPVSAERDLRTIAESPESERAGVIAQTRDTLGRFGAVFGLTATLAGAPALATESPYEPLADASGKTMLVVKNTISATEQQSLETEMEEMMNKKNFAKENFKYYLTLPQNDKLQILQCYKIGRDGNVDAKKLLFGVSISITLRKELSRQRKIVEAYLKDGTLDMQVGQKLTDLLEDIVKYIP